MIWLRPQLNIRHYFRNTQPLQTLTLLRHAKSGYVDGLTDFKRNLTERGRRDALNMATTLHERGFVPTSLLVSSAVRTRETAQIIREALGLQKSAVTHLSDLYLASPDALIREINHAVDTPHLMLIGHNPGIEALSKLLDPDSPERMSTCSLNHFELINLEADVANSLDTQQTRALSEARSMNAENSITTDEAINRLRVRAGWKAHLLFHEQPPS